MNDEKIFADGVIVKRHERAPDFVKCNLSIKMKDLIEFAKVHHKDGWLNLQVKESKGGKLYCELDTFKPSPQQTHNHGMAQAQAAAGNDNYQPAPPPTNFEDEDLPF